MEILDLNNEEDTKTTDEMEPKKPEEKTSPVKEILSWVLTIAFAIVAAILIKNYVIINANIPSGSMENTIQIGDDIFGFRLAYTFSDPKRGDIVIFNAPDSPSEKYIKRVIGLPGETVTIEDGRVYIDGEALEEDYLKSNQSGEDPWTVNAGPYEFKVPQDSYLLLGDNRNGSSDARVWEHCMKRYYPVSRSIIMHHKVMHTEYVFVKVQYHLLKSIDKLRLRLCSKQRVYCLSGG